MNFKIILTKMRWRNENFSDLIIPFSLPTVENYLARNFFSSATSNFYKSNKPHEIYLGQSRTHHSLTESF